MKYIYILCLTVASIAQATAQEYRLDVNLRATGLLVIGDDASEDKHRRSNLMPTIGASGEVLFFPKGFIGVGAFYSRSVVSGENEYAQGGTFNSNYVVSSLDYAMYGVSLQLTTSRKKGFRIYAIGRAGKFEVVEDMAGAYSLSASEFAYSGGFGIMVKLSRKVSFNIFEANYTFLPKQFSDENNIEVAGLYAQSGLSIRFMQKK